MSLKKLLFIAACCICQLVFTAKAQINSSDSLTLVDFYNSTNGPSWFSEARHNWLTIKPVKTWNGVTVTDGRVTSIFLSGSNLSGTLPASFGNLSALTGINVSGNNLTGSIPTGFFNLINLTTINFESNQLSGDINLIGNLTKLVTLDLNHNLFTGSLPVSIGKLTSLQYLQLFDNQFSGVIPNSIGQLASLAYFQIPQNQFTGNLPASIGNLVLLNTIITDNNQLSGELPASLGNLKNLTTLGLSFNQFSGNVPVTIFKLSKLTYLGLSDNKLYFKNNPQVAIGDRNLTLYLYDNDFNFNGLEFVAANFSMANYSPQAHLPVHINGNSLSVSAGGTLGNNTYTWYKSGVATGTVIKADSTFHPIESGIYYATIRNSVVRGLTLITDTIVYTSPLAAKPNSKLSVYPNPVINTINVMGLSANSKYTITVTDVSGNVWLNTTTINKTNVSYNLASLKPGNYMLTANDGINKLAVQFVKQ